VPVVLKGNGLLNLKLGSLASMAAISLDVNSSISICLQFRMADPTENLDSLNTFSKGVFTYEDDTSNYDYFRTST
jgi:hypothetical protein